MNKCFVILLLLFATSVFSQKLKSKKVEQTFEPSTSKNTASIDTSSTSRNKNKAKIEQYRVFSIENDTTYIDTTLTIKKEYLLNYLRKDNFGLLPFANEGQTYNTLQFGLSDFSPYPEFGFEAKHFNYLKPNDIKYYSVATPLTELYYKSVMEQGQTLDAFIAVSTSERLNFSIAYKGLRSIGRFVNQLSSSGNFRFTTNYNTKNKRYFLKAHFTLQDHLNAENGGIVTTADFEGKNIDFEDRTRLQVYFENATSLLEGNRYFLDHNFKLFQLNSNNTFLISHQMNLENKKFNFSQANPATVVQVPNPATFNRFGASFVASGINNTTKYNKIYNRFGLAYDNKTLGQFEFFVDDFNFNYSYNSVLVLNNKVIPNALNDRINTIGGQYKYRKNKLNGDFQFSNSISKQALSNLDLKLQYEFNDDIQLSAQLQKINKLPNHIYNLFQSSYVNYNWNNEFKNEKITNFQAFATTKWFDASMQYTTIGDKLYFSDDDITSQNLLLSTPKQYDKTINYLSIKVAREFTFGKFALDNTVLYQQVQQSELIVNVPQIVTRNTIYFSDWVFKRAMFIQTGFIVNYFSSYYANNYNPLIAEFYIQNDKKIGAFPMVDFFINAKVKQTRLYLKAEHFNSGFAATNTFYAAPNYPYRDFMVRFGLVWNFFQ